MKLPFVSQKKQEPSRPEKNAKRPSPLSRNANEEIGSGDELIQGLSDLYVPEDTDTPRAPEERDIIDVLVEMGKITPEQHAHLRQQTTAHKEKTPADVEDLLLNEGTCSADDILSAKAELCGLQFQHVRPEDVDKEAFHMLDLDFIKNSSLCPIAIDQQTLLVATSEPANILAIEDVKRQTQMDLEVIVCTHKDIEVVCDALTEDKIDDNLDDIISDMTEVEVVQDQQDSAEDLEKMAGQSPVIKFVNYLISNAIHEGASDI
ncbi:MAG: hypothetical protein JSV16_00625, partial [Candidatus Hydrogenedentota bacterium]